MDILITKKHQEVKLSSLGFYNISVIENAPEITLNKRTVKGRNGTIYDGATYNQKTIEVTGRILVSDMEAYMQLEDNVKGLLLDSEPFYITKMYPKSNLYDFQVPGQATGDIDAQATPHAPWKYRHKVTASHPSFSFLGKSRLGLKYDFSVTFRTAEMPFGETIPKDIILSHGEIPYAGNAEFSQLEYPYAVELTAAGGQSRFYLTIAGRKYTYESATPLASGEKLQIKGNATTLNGVNVTNKTNYEYFILVPSTTNHISYQTDFVGSIKIINFKEIYL